METIATCNETRFVPTMMPILCHLDGLMQIFKGLIVGLVCAMKSCNSCLACTNPAPRPQPLCQQDWYAHACMYVRMHHKHACLESSRNKQSACFHVSQAWEILQCIQSCLQLQLRFTDFLKYQWILSASSVLVYADVSLVYLSWKRQKWTKQIQSLSVILVMGTVYNALQCLQFLECYSGAWQSSRQERMSPRKNYLRVCGIKSLSCGLCKEIRWHWQYVLWRAVCRRHHNSGSIHQSCRHAEHAHSSHRQDFGITEHM